MTEEELKKLVPIEEDYSKHMHLELVMTADRILRFMNNSFDNSLSKDAIMNGVLLTKLSGQSSFDNAIKLLMDRGFVRVLGFDLYAIEASGRAFIGTTSLFDEWGDSIFERSNKHDEAHLTYLQIQAFPKTERRAKWSMIISWVSILIALGTLAYTINHDRIKDKEEAKTIQEQRKEQPKQVPFSPLIQKDNSIQKPIK